VRTLSDHWSLRKGPPVCKLPSVTGFQRARSEEQREVRRRAILDAAAGMLAEMPVAEVSLNGLSRRAGLAKSNVLRYFDSREAVLLELLDDAWREWLAALAPDLAGVGGPVAERRERTAAAVAASLAARPVLCDLLGAQAAVLERNVSPAVAARFKRAAIDNVTTLADLLRTALPELGDPAAERLAWATVLVAGALWAHGQPSAAVLAAYEADPSLATLRLDFRQALTEVLAVLIAGLLARGTPEPAAQPGTRAAAGEA
jgi:AcrR family transcriptional regulator